MKHSILLIAVVLTTSTMGTHPKKESFFSKLIKFPVHVVKKVI